MSFRLLPFSSIKCWIGNLNHSMTWNCFYFGRHFQKRRIFRIVPDSWTRKKYASRVFDIHDSFVSDCWSKKIWFLEQTHIINLENGLDLTWCLIGALSIHINMFVPHGGFVVNNYIDLCRGVGLCFGMAYRSISWDLICLFIQLKKKML